MATVREAIAELGVDGTKLPGDLRKADREFDKAGKRFGRKVGRGLRRGINKVGNLAGLGVGFGFGQGLRDAMAFDDQMQRLGSQARLTGDETEAFASQIDDVSNSTGIARDKLAGALDEMVNLEGGSALTTKNLETLSKGMLGTGTTGRDLSRVMFTLGQNMEISQEAMQGVLGGIDRIGAEASIPFAQLANSYVEVAAAASTFGDTGPESVFATVAAMQAMRKQIPTADEVKTSFTNLANELVKKRKQIEKRFDIQVTDDQGNALSLIETLDKLAAADLSDADISDVFGKRAAKGLRALLANFDQYQQLQEKGVRGAEQDFLGIRAMERAESSAGRTQKAFNRFKQALAEPFTGENLDAIATALQGISSLISKSISGWGELLSLFNEDSSNRKLIDDSSTGEVVTAAGRVAFGSLRDETPRPLLRGTNELGQGPGILPFDRPQVQGRVEANRQAIAAEQFPEQVTTPGPVEQGAAPFFEIDYKRLGREVGREVGKQNEKLVGRPGARASRSRTEPTP